MIVNDIIIYVIAPTAIGAMAYLYQRHQKRKDEKAAKNAEKLSQIWDMVTALKAHREGQMSFAETLVKEHAATTLIQQELKTIHESINQLYKYFREYVDERIKQHEIEHHTEIS